jgi:hypothetical protein
MTTDREMLEMAAKAAGIDKLYPKPGFELQFDEHDTLWIFGNGDRIAWYPLHDDGDALRLAVELRLHIETWVDGLSACAIAARDGIAVYEAHNCDDPKRATRRAIVRAAAEIGREMK